MRKLLSILLAITLLSACVTNPNGTQTLSPEGEVILTTSINIAVRHFVTGDPRASEKVAHIRIIVARVQSVVNSESTLSGLAEVASQEIDKLNLTPIEKADAHDLLNLIAVAVEAKLGPKALDTPGLVKVRQFLAQILAAIPAV
jgi:hypothetical protein